MSLTAHAWELRAPEEGDGEAKTARCHVSLLVDAPQRSPADLCLVIDVSGSMQMPAVLKDQESAVLSILDIVSHSCRTVLQSLSPDDRLAIVTYSDQAQVVLPLTCMDAQGQGEAEAAVQKLRADGQTNLWQGLETALELFRTAPDHGPARRAAVPAALVLTDGVPNVEPSGGHLQALRNYRERNGGKLPCTVHTFGFSSDLDSKLLDALAAGGGGGFVFIPDAGFVGTALVNCTAGALAAGGRNARLQLSLGDEVSLEGVLGYQLEEDGSLDLGSVQLGQRKDMILDFKYSSSASELCRMSVSYDGAEGEVTLEETSSLPGLDPPDADGTYQSLRLETFEVIQKILGLEALADAQREVEHFIERLKEAKAGSDDARLDGLLEDVQGQVSEAVSREDWYRSWGVHYLRSLARAHLGQVCNNFKDPGVQCYGGEIFREVRDVADEIFLKLPAANPAIRSHVETLTALGFSEEEVQRALEYAYDDVEMAATYLMEGLPAYRPGLHPGRGHAPGSPPAPRTVDMAAYYDAAGG
ncbi:unnamed protein product [Durusdinium trenchii]|uniref:Uncharacterized protein n=2 Tax=Durusdinium trenchii TaxID=1381693 RepID=A0ABP0NUJ9_9DINO